jgi:K+-transporting ATPase ATPase C chain
MQPTDPQPSRAGLDDLVMSALKVTAMTLVACLVLYPITVWMVAQAVVPEGAMGSLVRDGDGTVRGSRLVGQAFSSPGYFWGRPSAVGYDGAGAGGSNLAPSNPALRARIEARLEALGATAAPVPADLVMASGSGLDPDISAEAALFQVPRVAAARSLPAEQLRQLVADLARRPIPWDDTRLINVLELNVALDALPR